MDRTRRNRGYEATYKEYEDKRRRIGQMGGEAAIKKQHASSKLTARERIAYFFDNGTFTEIGPFVTHRTSIPSGQP